MLSIGQIICQVQADGFSLKSDFPTTHPTSHAIEESYKEARQSNIFKTNAVFVFVKVQKYIKELTKVVNIGSNTKTKFPESNIFKV